MASKHFAFLISLLLLFYGSLGRRESFQQSPNECQLREIKPFEPTLRAEAEAGVTELWDPTNDQFRCGGAHVFRHIIRPNATLLPSYTNSPLIIYVLQGKGRFGIVRSGCPNAHRARKGADTHQKVGGFQKGDIIVFPEGVAHWVANTAKDDNVVLIVLQDTANTANQLDANPLRFFLAGNRQPKEQRQQDAERKEKVLERLGYGGGSLLSGFRFQSVKDSFKTDSETAKNLLGEKDERGHIVRLKEEEILSILPPPSRSSEEDEGQSGSRHGSNGLQEAICTVRVRQNIDNPSRADIYDPLAGHFTTLNKFTLPIFEIVKLSAAHGSLKRNYGIVPKWCMNAHSYVYVTKGSAGVQIVNNRGESVLDDEVREGQLFLVPQDFAVVLEAGDEGFEWVEFNTNADARFNTLSGSTSTIAGIPAGILSAFYQLPQEKAAELKRNLVSNFWFFKTSGSSSSGRYASI